MRNVVAMLSPRTSIAVTLAALLFPMLTLLACGPDASKSPPQSAVKDGGPCSHCDMTITDLHHSASASARRDGVTSNLHFDDIGCMLDHMQEHPELEFTESFVRNADTSQWIPASQAIYIMSPQIHTAMASGIAAYPDNDHALAAAKLLSITPMTWPELLAARKKHLESK